MLILISALLGVIVVQLYLMAGIINESLNATIDLNENFLKVHFRPDDRGGWEMKERYRD